MADTLPIWFTTRRIWTHCWRERTLALKYGAGPTAVLLAIDLAGIAAKIDIDKNPPWQIVTVLLTLLLYAPFTVTWFQSIVRDGGAAVTRPVFILAGLEKSVILANLRIMAFVLSLTLAFALAIGVLLYGVSRVAPTAVSTVGFILAPVALFFWVMFLTRASVAIAYAAAGEPIGLIHALRLTKPMAFSMTWVNIMLSTACLLMGLPIAWLGWKAGLRTGPGASIGLSLLNAVGGMVYLIWATTLFAMVYRRLKAEPA